MLKRNVFIPAIWTLVFFFWALPALTDAQTGLLRTNSDPGNHSRTPTDIGRMKAEPISGDRIVRPFDPVTISGEDFCLIQSDNDDAFWYFPGFRAGDGFALHMDPAQCGLPDPYPFKITDVHLYLYDPGGYTWPVEIQVNVRDLSDGDKCDGPGDLLCFQTYTIPADSAYPNLMHLDFDWPCCVHGPFFLEVLYTGESDSAYPSLVMTDETTNPVDTCDAWVWYFYETQYWYFEWYWFWAPPYRGYPIMRAGGYTQVAECDSCWYWKSDRPYQDHPAPSGMPDFDQNQADWLAYCGPTAAANCLWWLNAVPEGMTPPELIELLGEYFHTRPEWGTYIDTMQIGLEHYFQDFGLTLQESTFYQPNFFEMEDSLKACQNIVLLIGFWWSPDGMDWYREGGHFVSMAGVCSESLKIAISDPDWDGAVQGAPGRVRPPEHPPYGDYDATLHNDPTYVSHDIYDSDLNPALPSPGNPFWEINYPYGSGKYSGMNVPEKFKGVTRLTPEEAVFYATEVEYGVMIVGSLNDAPVVSDIPDQTIFEGESFAPISLDDYVTDPDDHDSVMIWSHWGEIELLVDITDGVATICVPHPDWNDSETIWFKACDPGGLCDSNEATFTVTAENDTPVVSDIANQTIAEGESFNSINLDDYVTDPDDHDSVMTWTHWGETELLVDITDRVVTISVPNPDWNGSETVWFKACDPGGLCDSNEATFTVLGADFAIDVFPDTVTVFAGDTAGYMVTLTSINGFASACTLTVSGHPDGSTPDFDPPVVVPTNSSVLTLFIPDTTTPETFTLTVTATEMDKVKGIAHSKDVTLIVIGPDFTIDAYPDTQFVYAGQNTNYQVVLTSLLGFSSPCTLTATGLPEDASVEFDPNPVTPTDTSLMTVSTAETTPPANYTLTVTSAELGKGQIEHSAQVVLRVSRVDTLFIVAYSPVDLIVTDPAEDSISLWFNTILDADYDTTADLNGDGDKDDSVTIPNPYVGEYLIRVIREPDAADDDTFTIGIRVDGGSQFLLVQGDTVPPAGEMISYSYDCPAYLRGDLNRDHATDIADVVFLINYLFLWQSPPEPLELGDVNCDESIDVGDLMYLINYLFLGTSAPCSGPVTGFS